MAGRPLVSARRDLRCNHWKLDFRKRWCCLDQRDSRSFLNLDARAISPWWSRALISDAASLVHPRIPHGRPHLRGTRCEQSCFFAFLSKLRSDKGAYDCDWRVSFALHSAHEDRNLRVTRRAKCRIDHRRRISGTWRHGCNQRNPAMARYVQRDLVSPARYFANVFKWLFDIVAKP